MSDINRVTAYLKVTAEFYDPEATPETVRACVEQDFVTANECKCGGTPSLRKTAANDEATLYYLKCLKCGAMGYWSKKIETAVENWNDGEKIYFLGKE